MEYLVTFTREEYTELNKIKSIRLVIDFGYMLIYLTDDCSEHYYISKGRDRFNLYVMRDVGVTLHEDKYFREVIKIIKDLENERTEVI